MARKAAEVVLELRAESAQYLARLRGAETQYNRTMAGIRRSAGVTGSFVQATFGGLLAGVSVAGLLKLSDAATSIDNALKVAGLSGEELDRVYGRLRESALANAAPLQALTELYSRASLVQNELGVSTEQLLTFTDRIAVALRVSGKSASESAGALLQLSQALGGGVVRAEEFNSIQEGAPAILQAAAAGIREAEGSVAKLRKIMLDGKLASRALFDGFIAGSSLLQERVAGVDLTVGQAFGNLQTSLIHAAREFNRATGAAKGFALGINNVAEGISDAVDPIVQLIERISRARQAVEGFLQSIGNSDAAERFAELVTGLELAPGQPIDLSTVEAQQKIEALEREIELVQQIIANNVEVGVSTTEAHTRLRVLRSELAVLRGEAAGVGSMSGQTYRAGTPGDPNALAQETGGAPGRTEAISIKDDRYKPPPGSGGRAKAKRENEFERELASIRERTEALRAETAAQATLNPLVDDFGYAVARAGEAQELLTAAKDAGIAAGKELSGVQQLLAGDFANLSPKAREQAETMLVVAEGYAQAEANGNRLADAQDRIRESAEAAADFQKDLARGVVDGLLEGAEAADILADALKKVGNRLLDLAFDAAFGGGSNKGEGFLSALFQGLGSLIKPRERGGPVSAGQPYIVGEKRPELFVPEQNGMIIPRVPEISRAASGRAASISQTSVYNVDARGAQRGAGDEIVAAIAAYDKGRRVRLAADLPELRRRGAI